MKQQITENQGDFLQCIGVDLSMRIMSFLDDPADLIRARAVSRFWRQFGEWSLYTFVACFFLQI